MADIFISYKSERRNAAQHLSRILELNGYSVWFDYGLFSGIDFGRQIEREIRAAKVVVVLWCSLSRDSRWVLEEAHLAQRLETFTPVWLERVDPPLGFGRADTIDLTTWEGAPRSPHLDRLLSEIARRVGRDPVPQFRGLQSYELTWRSLGAPSLATFALSTPVEQHESERLPDKTRENKRRAAETKRRAEETKRRAAEERQRQEAEKEHQRREAELKRLAKEQEQKGKQEQQKGKREQEKTESAIDKFWAQAGPRPTLEEFEQRAKAIFSPNVQSSPPNKVVGAVMFLLVVVGIFGLFLWASFTK